VEGVPKFHIRPPSTTNDNGLPSDSIGNDIKRLFALIDDERHITAYKLLSSIRNRIVAFETKYQIQIPSSTTTTSTTSTATTTDDVPNGNKENNSNNGLSSQPGKNKNGILLGSNRRNNKTSKVNTTSTTNSTKGIGLSFRRIGNVSVSPETAIIITSPIIKKLTKAEKLQFEKSYQEMEHVKHYLEHKHDTIGKLEVG
jgi:hypothetical protein